MGKMVWTHCLAPMASLAAGLVHLVVVEPMRENQRLEHQEEVELFGSGTPETDWLIFCL